MNGDVLVTRYLSLLAHEHTKMVGIEYRLEQEETPNRVLVIYHVDDMATTSANDARVKITNLTKGTGIEAHFLLC